MKTELTIFFIIDVFVFQQIHVSLSRVVPMNNVHWSVRTVNAFVPQVLSEAAVIVSILTNVLKTHVEQVRSVRTNREVLRVSALEEHLEIHIALDVLKSVFFMVAQKPILVPLENSVLRMISTIGTCVYASKVTSEIATLGNVGI